MQTRFEDWIWRRAVGFRQALELYAPTEIAAPYLDPQNPNSRLATGILAAFEAFNNPKWRMLAEASPENALATLAPKQFEWSQADENADAWMRQQIWAGNLLLFGFERPRRHDCPALQISNNASAGSLDFALDTAAFDGLNYEQVRLASTDMVKTERLEWRKLSGALSPRLQPGRPRKADKIVEVFWDLHAQGAIDERSVNSNIPQIKRAFAERFPDLDVSGETIRRAISPILRQEKPI